jgi:hypothetical protein
MVLVAPREAYWSSAQRTKVLDVGHPAAGGQIETLGVMESQRESGCSFHSK